MPTTIFLALMTLAVSIPSGGYQAAPAADYYKLSGVRRVEQDLYKTSDGLFVQTRYCYHYTYGEEAILKWEGQYSYSNKVIWSDESTCDVKGVFKG